MSANNNINKRIKNTKANIIKNQNKAPNNLSLQERLQPYTKGFINLIQGKNSNNKPNNTNINLSTNNNLNKNDSPFSNPIVLIIIISIAVLFISYGVYKFTSSSSEIKIGKTYYGKELIDYEPVFKLNTNKIEDCINRCNLDTLCNGITFDDETQQCMGTKDGKLRNDTVNYKAWVKGEKEDIGVRTGKLVGYANDLNIVDKKDIPRPKLPTEFNYSFYIYVEDFYDNQGSWKHIFHKGTEIDTSISLDTPNWNDIVRDYPEQSIGVWIAPYNNNIRIAITTSRLTNGNGNGNYKHAFQQQIHNDKVYLSDVSQGKFRDPTLIQSTNTLNNAQNTNQKIIRDIEYIDIYRIPIKKIIHISVNFIGMTMEVYMNGNLYKIKNLQGYPEFNDGHLYCMYDKTINGSIIDVKFTPEKLKHTEILEHTSNKKQLENKTLKQIRKIAK